MAEGGAERYVSGFEFMIAGNGRTSLTAYDLNEGIIKWKIPLGEVPELAGQGDQEYGHALSEGWAGGDGGWADLHGHARSQGACA